MKLIVDIYGVEQACDFDTMKTTAFLVMNIFGESIRVPITDEQMELVTEKATIEHQQGENDLPLSTDQFDETKAQMTGPPVQRGMTSERTFSPMASLEGQDPLPPEETEETDPAFGGAPTGFDGLFDMTEDQKAAQLRARNANARRQPTNHASDSAGNPIMENTVSLPSSSSLPAIGNPASDDDFPQD